MATSRLSELGDWTFGQQKAGYLTQSDEIRQNVVTRIKSFKNDWFLDLSANIDWFNLLSNKSTEETTERQITRTVIGTAGVRILNELNIDIDRENREATISLTYTDIYDEIITTTIGVS